MAGHGRFLRRRQRIVGHAADSYHRIDIRQTSRHLLVRCGERLVADSSRPLVLYESGFAPRWYVPRADIEVSLLTPVEGQTFCPYKGLASNYDIGDTALHGPMRMHGPRSRASPVLCPSSRTRSG